MHFEAVDTGPLRWNRKSLFLTPDLKVNSDGRIFLIPAPGILENKKKTALAPSAGAAMINSAMILVLPELTCRYKNAAAPVIAIALNMVSRRGIPVGILSMDAEWLSSWRSQAGWKCLFIDQKRIVICSVKEPGILLSSMRLVAICSVDP